jgi:hypothetical protein
VDIEIAAPGCSLPLDDADEAKFQDVMKWIRDAQIDSCRKGCGVGSEVGIRVGSEVGLCTGGYIGG